MEASFPNLEMPGQISGARHDERGGFSSRDGVETSIGMCSCFGGQKYQILRGVWEELEKRMDPETEL